MQWRVVALLMSVIVAWGLARWAAQSLAADNPPAAPKDAEKKAASEKAPKADEKPQEKEGAKPPAVNPLQNLIQKLLPRPAAQPRVNVNPRGANNQKPADPDARDQIDARAAKDRKQAELIRKASAAVDANDWSAALELLQNLLAQEEDSVERVGANWQSVRERAMKLMLRLPDEVVRAFRQRTAAEASRRLEEAEQSGRIDRLAQVAMRYLLLEAGQTAAQRLAVRHLDRGEFALATRWFRWLDDVGASITQDRRWQLQAALAARQAGQKELAEKWLKRNGLREPGDGSRSTSEEDEQIEMGGARRRVSEWWSSLPDRVPQQTIATEWPMFLGAPNRAALSRDGEPLLLSRWSQPLTQVQPLQRQIEMLVEDMHDQNRATISVCHPLLINGLVVLRTLGGVQVFEVETGRPLWSTDERFKAEDLIAAGTGQPTYVSVNRVIRFVNGVQQVDYTNTSLEQHPLGQLLFANGNFGMLSSDGRQLFSVEDDTFVNPQLGYYGGNEDLSRRDALRRNWSCNKLVSYDLRTGHPLWTVGGVETNEPFQPELPGVFFFGAPVADGHELFVVGERDGEIRLFCLQAETGKSLWSQLLATAESTISRDAARRQFAAQVSLADGVVICPTTVGWLVAVDRASRQLLWVHRYAAPQQNTVRRGFGQPVTPLLPWGRRWVPSAPVIVGDAVVYTPQEPFDEQQRACHIICLGLHDGTRRWLRPMENWLALNGVGDGKVLLLGQSAPGGQCSLGALSLANGNPVWTQPIPNSDGVPSGLGVISGDRWHVPLTSGQVWTLSLKDGSRTGRQWTASRTRLGNLSMYRGAVISAHAAGLTCFEQREAVVEEIRRRREKDPHDLLALLTEAAILQLERKSNDAWNVLQRVRGESVPEELRPRYLATLREVLTDVIQQSPAERESELGTFERWLTSAEDRWQARRLRVEQRRGRGDHLAALELLLEISRDADGAVLTLSGPPITSIRADAWIAGQLADLWKSLPDDVRSDMDRRLTREIERLDDAPPETRRRGLELFAFHPATRALRWKQIEADIREGDFSRAELALLRLADGVDASESARAWQRLVELYRSLDLNDDAAVAGQRLNRLDNTPLSNDLTAKQWVDQEIAAGRLARAASATGADWSTLEFTMERSVGYQGNADTMQECALSDARWPFFTAQRFQYQMMNSPVATQRLVMSRLSSGQFDWSLPLRNKPTSTAGYGTAIRTVGHQVLVFHREVLHWLSPVDRRVVWTRPMESRGVNYFDPMQATRRQTLPMKSSAEFQSQPWDSSEELARSAALTLCTPELVGYRGRRVLTIADAATGQWRWELRELPTDARVLATNDLIFVVSASRWPNGLLLDARDGRPLPFEDAVRERFQAAKTTLGSDLLAVSKPDANSLAVERWNPMTRQSVWREAFPVTSQFAWLDARTLATLGADGSIKTFDLDSREARTVGMLQPADFAGLNQRRFLVADADRLFLIVSGQQTTTYYGDEFASIPVHGTIFAFDRHQGGELWRQKVENQGLVLNQFGVAPVLFFSTRKFEQRGRIHVQVHRLLLLDKKTGRKLFDEEFTNQFSGYRALNVNLAERQVELLTYNDRLRLIGREASPK